MANCPGHRFLGARRLAMLWLFATTGARLKEVSGLELADLNWKAQLIQIVMGKGQKEHSGTLPQKRPDSGPLLRTHAG